MVWMLKFCTASALAIVLLKLLGGPDDKVIVLNTDDENYVTATRYLDRWTTPKVVIVGSSLSARLLDEYFKTPEIENIAFKGGTQNTGLELLANNNRSPEFAGVPQLVLVETNIHARPIDKKLLVRLANRTTLFKPVRAAAKAYEDFLHPPRSREQLRADFDGIVTRPPSPNGLNSGLTEEVLREARRQPPIDDIQHNLAEMAELIRSVEAKGSRVRLFRLPYSPELENTPLALANQRMVAEAFPQTTSWLQYEVDGSMLRWTDGIHLDERSAIIVARAIEDSAIKQLNTK